MVSPTAPNETDEVFVTLIEARDLDSCVWAWIEQTSAEAKQERKDFMAINVECFLSSEIKIVSKKKRFFKKPL
jgi:hypothetical protein